MGTKMNEEMLASVLVKSAWINYRHRDYGLALNDYKRALDLKQTSDDKESAISIQHNIALIYCKQHFYDHATEILNQVRDHIIASRGPDDLSVAKVHIDLGNICCKRNEYNVAEEHYNKADEILGKADCPENHPYQTEYLHSISRLWSKLN